ncbi:MAG TPA: hypothetical protein VMZ53_32185, partial [Kofleriaceae bacterium]|nr:hypothetical protein [Kofleriaceae bacterium]
MREVAAKVDFGEIGTAVGDNALEHECGRGGRVEKGSQLYRFTYLEKGGYGRWEIELREQQIRDIAAGLIEEIEAVQLAEGTRANRGDALIVWGEYDEDGLRVRTLSDLAIVLDGMAASSMIAPCLVRLWGTSDQQAIAALNGLDAAVYVIESEQGYGRSVGDPTRTETFRIIDHDVGSIDIPWADVVPWRIVRDALLRFVEYGDLGDQVILDGSIPTQFLMLGDYDRQAELASRRPPPMDPAQSSLPQKAPHGEWAKRLLRTLIELQLIEIDMHIVDAILARLAILLVAHGDDALDAPEPAQQLAKQISKVRGVGALFATGGDLQIALRRTQEPPTMPVE